MSRRVEFTNRPASSSNIRWDADPKRVECSPDTPERGNPMDEEALNMSIRKFLKKVGITSQREIERAIDQANSEGRLDGNPVAVKITLECALIDDALSIEDEIKY
jgi:hypothetical protein